EATAALRNAAGNFYINDKPTGAVVGQQPFGGSRASGTNDKAGSKLNLTRWTSARTIKETFSPPREHKYPYMSEEYSGCRILDVLLDLHQELNRLAAVNDAMVVAEGDIHHRANDDGAVLRDRAILDLVQPEDADLRRVQDRRAHERSEDAAVRD